MKKAILVLFIVGIFAAGAFAAEPMRLTMATGGTAGTYYPFGGALAQVMGEKSGVVSITAQASGATGENLNLIGNGDVELALVQNDLAHYAYAGLEIYKDNKVTNFKAIARLYPEVIHVVAQAGSGIKTIGDFKGKKVSVGASGSGNEANCRQIFELYELAYDNISPIFISYAETTNHFKDRQIDAFVYTTGIPNPSIMDIMTMQDAVFVPIDGTIRDEIIKKYPFFAADAIPANSYSKQTEDVGTVAVQCMLVVRDDIPDDIVYAMTKALFENLDALGTAHAKGKDVSLERALDGVTVPLHPGAERYFKEAGIVK
ncbi:MAG: TAXI family TRAP transporter solute-binding subunit [Synergistaceae bacterium]|jgi:TRAP transporter TAXI family solute receptor|nr:TAXI family TRAP transporter solute-binding subunit [Synergistaceae bacterium]